MALDALLFDIDGTLVDTNAAHVEAWQRAFAAHGYRVARDRIEVEIGKGGDKLVPAILGAGADARDGDSLRAVQPAEFARIGHASRFRLFPGAPELLKAVRERGLKAVLVTSSSQAHLDVLTESSGFDLAGACDLLVTADDAEESKPAPDLVQAALRKLGMSAAQCAMLGDSIYDMHAARRAGVIGMGLLTGYESRQTLKQSGARAVWSDTGAVLDQLGEALTLASPTAVRLTSDVLAELMRAALAEARHGLDSGEAPIGSLLLDGHGQVLARAFNQENRLQDRTAHGEMVAFRSASRHIHANSRDLILVSTLEPCVMCTGAAMVAAVDTVIYALSAPADSGSERVEPPVSPQSQVPRLVGGVLAAESRALFQEFASRTREPQQRAFAEQLLSLT